MDRLKSIKVIDDIAGQEIHGLDVTLSECKSLLKAKTAESALSFEAQRVIKFLISEVETLQQEIKENEVFINNFGKALSAVPDIAKRVWKKYYEIVGVVHSEW